MIVNPVFSKTGKRKTNKKITKTSQSAAQETQTSNVFKDWEFSGRATNTREMTVFSLD